MSADRRGVSAEAAARRAGVLVGALADRGVVDAVVSPGSRNTPVVLALAEHPAVRVHVVLDERSAGFVALGLARATGRPVVLSCTSGSAGANWMPAIVEAGRSGLPLVAVTADRPAELHGVGAPQTMPQARLFGEHVRLFVDLPAPGPDEPDDWVATAVDRAIDAGGPVHLNVAFREPLWAPGAGGPVPARARVVAVGRRVPTPDQVRALASRLVGRRGIVWCGHREVVGPEPDPLGPLLGRLAERLGWPLLAEPTSGAGFATGAVRAHEALIRAGFDGVPEVFLRFGQDPTSRPVYEWAARHGRGRTVLVDPDGARHDPRHVADTLVVADEVALCEALLDALPATGDDAFRAAWSGADARAEAALSEACADGFWEGGIVRSVVRACPPDAMLHVASSMAVRDVEAFAPPLPYPLRVASNRGTNGIDGTLSTAIGESLGRSGPVVLLTGDLAFLHDLGALVTARRDGLRVCVVVVDNGGGGIFEYLPIRDHDRFAPLFLTPQDADPAALAQAAGARVARVASLPELDAALQEHVGAPGLSVIVATVDRADSVARHKAAWEAVAASL